MLVVLKQDVKGTGKKGEVVTVSDGFGKNFLINTGKGVLANNTVINEIKQKQMAENFHEEENRKHAQQECDKVHNKTITLKIKAGDGGKIFGSVTSKEIEDELTHLKVEVDKKKIELQNPIKNLGEYTIKVKFYKGITATVFLNVIAE
ncbi:MAG: 50S ribosomal protein L9 [Tenericutes bacterium HGW-Tenericutes-4]|jgi:large subunit ribosomal protein L9|nr:MAG: 50S ribosomal protein L9 [Tenericutes bacterium HGW-Tenericutes-4]